MYPAAPRWSIGGLISKTPPPPSIVIGLTNKFFHSSPILSSNWWHIDWFVASFCFTSHRRIYRSYGGVITAKDWLQNGAKAFGLRLQSLNREGYLLGQVYWNTGALFLKSHLMPLSELKWKHSPLLGKVFANHKERKISVLILLLLPSSQNYHTH